MLHCLVEKSLALFFVIFFLFFVVFFFLHKIQDIWGCKLFSLTSTLDLNGHQHMCQYWFHYYYYFFPIAQFRGAKVFKISGQSLVQ